MTTCLTECNPDRLIHVHRPQIVPYITVGHISVPGSSCFQVVQVHLTGLVLGDLAALEARSYTPCSPPCFTTPDPPLPQANLPYATASRACSRPAAWVRRAICVRPPRAAAAAARPIKSRHPRPDQSGSFAQVRRVEGGGQRHLESGRCLEALVRLSA